MTDSPILRAVRHLPDAPRYLVAYSGGIDSHVLLHALTICRIPVSVFHVHHGLSPNAEAWTRHCAEVCAALGVPLEILRVDAGPLRGESPEAAARRARYEVFAERLGEGEMLLVAHNRDDQAETLLLQLLRGAGPAGLAAMPRTMPFGRGVLARPLLGVSRSAIRAHAEAHGLAWIEDESNADLRYDRNYLRAEVLPRLKVRWPALGRTLARSAGLQAETLDLLADLAALDLERMRGTRSGTLAVSALAASTDVRRRNALRHWIASKGLPMPDSGRLARIEHEVIAARPEAAPRVAWPGAEVRRYRDDLYAMPPLAAHDRESVIEWRVDGPLETPLGPITPDDLRACGVEWVPGEVLTVRYRRGGETLQARGRTHSLKKLFQEWGIPPWGRDRLPFVYRGDRLLAVIRRALA